VEGGESSLHWAVSLFDFAGRTHCWHAHQVGLGGVGGGGRRQGVEETAWREGGGGECGLQVPCACGSRLVDFAGTLNALLARTPGMCVFGGGVMMASYRVCSMLHAAWCSQRAGV
jgi:hypothetical protein